MEKKDDEVSINIAKENAFNIASSKSGLEISKKKHSLQYGKFLKTSTLQDGNMIKDNTFEVVENDDTKEDLTVIKLTDEELFKACGGRTAHKGARHGLTLNGKLSRIAEQEKQLLASASFLNTNVASSQCTEVKQKKKKKRKKSMETEENTSILKNEDVLDQDNLIPPPLESEENYVPSKKSSKRVKRKIQDLTRQLTKSCTIEDESIDNEEGNPSKKKKKRSNDTCLEQTSENRKKKSKRKQNNEIANATHVDGNNKDAVPLPDSDDISADIDCPIAPTSVQGEESHKVSRKSVRRVKRKIHDLTHQLNKSCMIHDNSIDDEEERSSREKTEEQRIKPRKSKHKNKKKFKQEQDQETVSTTVLDDDIPMEPCIKKFRKSDTDSSAVFCDAEQSDESEDMRNLKNTSPQSCKKQKYTYCPNTESKKLNEKIRFKKLKKLQRKEKKRLERLTLDESTSEENDTKETKPYKKKYKKNKNRDIVTMD